MRMSKVELCSPLGRIGCILEKEQDDFSFLFFAHDRSTGLFAGIPNAGCATFKVASPL